MCLSLAAFNALAGTDAADGPGCRCASSTRAAWPRPFPTTSKPCSAWSSAAPQDVPVITVDGPTASGKGTLAAALAQRLGYHLLDSGALYRATALAAHAGRRRPMTTPPRWRASRRGLDLRFDGERILPARRGASTTSCARSTSARMASQGVGAARRARGPARAAAGLPPRARSGGRRARHGHGGLPDGGAQGVPHRERRAARRCAGISS